ncbi:MAG: sugar epimerase [Bacteroidota bacterium]
MDRVAEPVLIEGGHYTDARGTLTYNNTFDAAPVRRIYFVENASPETVRAWQAHQTEQRWFTAITGSFTIKLVKIDHWESPARDLKQLSFTLTAGDFTVLHVPGGYASSIQATQPHSTLMAMGDYLMGAIQDEYRFAPDYFLTVIN